MIECTVCKKLHSETDIEVMLCLDCLSNMQRKYNRLIGAEKMLEVVKRWLNIEPIEKEIWEDFNKRTKV